MILVISRFKVANGMVEPVRRAFLERPRLVDGVPGFLGMETFTMASEPSVFHLVTRWVDEPTFRRWHASDSHRDSHSLIPKGLKLDPDFTRVEVLERIDPERPLPEPEHQVLDLAPFLARFLLESESVTLLVLTPEGTILSANRRAQALIRRGDLEGTEIWPWLTEHSAHLLRERITHADQSATGTLLLHWMDARGQPCSLRCRVDVQPARITLLGEPTGLHQQALEEQLVEINNELAALARDNARKTREVEEARLALEKTAADLEKSYWHIKKIQEVLPICIECGKVKVAEAHWKELRDYFKENFSQLSHGYCPECFKRAMAQMDDAPVG